MANILSCLIHTCCARFEEAEEEFRKVVTDCLLNGDKKPMKRKRVTVWCHEGVVFTVELQRDVLFLHGGSQIARVVERLHRGSVHKGDPPHARIRVCVCSGQDGNGEKVPYYVSHVHG